MTIPVGIAAREGAPDLSLLAETLQELSDLGVDNVELPAYAYDVVLAGRPMPARIAELVAICAGRGHGYTMHGPLTTNLMGPADALPRSIEVTTCFIEIAARIGAPHLVLHAGMVTADDLATIEDAYARQREALARLGDIAREHDVIICVENLFVFGPFAATPSPARLARELRAVDHPAIRATFDFSHGTIHAAQTGFDFLAEAEMLAPLARHLHLHDSFGSDDLIWAYNPAESVHYGRGDLHLPVGWGSTPWPEIAARCRFPRGAIAIHELNPRFWRDRAEAVANARRVASGFATL